MVEISNFLPGVILLLIAGFEIGLFVFFWRYVKTIAIKAYLGFIAGVVIWVISNAVALLMGNGDVTVPIRFTYVGGTLIISCLLLFVHAFPHPRTNTINILKWFPLLTFVVFSFLALFTQTFILDGGERLENGVMMVDTFGAGLIAWTAFALIVLVFVFVELIKRFRLSAGEERSRLRYLLYGILISAVVGVATDVLMPVLHVIHFAWLGPLFSLVWLWFSVKAVRV